MQLMQEEDHGNEEEQLQAQRRVASVIERWESRNISAEALQHMCERASTGRRSWSADGSAVPASSSVSSVPQVNVPWLHALQHWARRNAG